MRRLRITAAAAAAWLASATAAQAAWPAAWYQPTEPFHVVGNIHYVGGKGLAAYLITSPQGHILLDATLAENEPFVERNIQALGFKLTDIKVLLNTHGHFDHAAGLAAIKAASGAKLYANAIERPILESGVIKVENSNDLPAFPPVRVDRVIRDGETVRVGPNVLTAILTPGHTPGCTSWKMNVVEGGRTLRVILPCSLTTGGNKLVGATVYPNIVADFRRSFDRLDREQADVTLTSHPELSDVLGRAQRQKEGAKDAFVDPGQLGRLVARSRREFEAQLAKEEVAAR